MKKSKLSSKALTIDKLYFGLSVFLIAAAIVSIAVSKGENFKNLFWHGTTLGIYPDLFESVIHARTRNPYEIDAIYPAFAYCLIYFFNFFIPGKYTDNFDDLAAICSNTETLVIAHIFYAVITLTIAYFIIKSFGKDKSIGKYLMVLIFVTSSPFLFLIERGNTVIITIVFLFIYLLYYNSENKKLRELALICLACAAAMKLYPAVFGILLLADKKYKEAIRAIIYGIVLFIVPFVFMGGIGQIPVMLSNSLTLNNDTLSGSTGFGYGFKVNATSSIGCIADWLFGKSYTVYIKIVVYFFVGLLLFGSLFIKTNWKRVAALSLVVILMPDFSFIYNVIYLLVPMCFFIAENKGKKLTFWNTVYTLLFVGAFAPLPYGDIFRSIGGYNNMNWGTLVSSFSLIAMGILLACEGIYACSKKKKIITAGVLVVSIAFGGVPYLLSNQTDLQLFENEEIWATSEDERLELDKMFDFMLNDLEKDEEILCFPYVQSLSPLEKNENVYYYTNLENSNSVNKARIFKELMPQFVVLDLTNYSHYQDKIIDTDETDEYNKQNGRTIDRDEYDGVIEMQNDILTFVNKYKYSVVKYLVTENHRYIAVWEHNDYAENVDFWNDGGTGKQDDPYRISSYEQLCLFSDVTNCGKRFTKKFIALTKDIDATSDYVFTPIAKHGGVCIFEGVFDGQGHIISNLNLAYKYNKETSDYSNIAFVNNLNGAIINLSIENSTFTGASCGVFVRESNSSGCLIANCLSKNNVIKAKLRAGAVADKYGAAIVNCVATENTIKGVKNAGFLGLKNAGASVVNSFTSDADPSNHAAALTTDLINTQNMASSMNKSMNTFVKTQEEFNSKQKKKKNKVTIYDYCKWSYTNNELSLKASN